MLRDEIRMGAGAEAAIYGATSVTDMAGLPAGVTAMRTQAGGATAYISIGADASLAKAVAAAAAAHAALRSAGFPRVDMVMLQQGLPRFEAAGALAAFGAAAAANNGFLPPTPPGAPLLYIASPQCSSGAWNKAAAAQLAATALPGMQLSLTLSPQLRADGTMLGERRTTNGGFFWSSALAAQDEQVAAAAAQAEAAAPSSASAGAAPPSS